MCVADLDLRIVFAILVEGVVKGLDIAQVSGQRMELQSFTELDFSQETLTFGRLTFGMIVTFKGDGASRR